MLLRLILRLKVVFALYVDLVLDIDLARFCYASLVPVCVRVLSCGSCFDSLRCVVFSFGLLCCVFMRCVMFGCVMWSVCWRVLLNCDLCC